MAMPSETAMVTNSRGKPPAARTPSLALWASRASERLQGVTSFQVEATPTWGLSKSASVMPTARSIARDGARRRPSVTSWLWILSERILSVIGLKLVGLVTGHQWRRLRLHQLRTKSARRRDDLARGATACPGRCARELRRGSPSSEAEDAGGDGHCRARWS